MEKQSEREALPDAKGTAKEAEGRLTHDPDAEADGRIEKAAGIVLNAFVPARRGCPARGCAAVYVSQAARLLTSCFSLV